MKLKSTTLVVMNLLALTGCGAGSADVVEQRDLPALEASLSGSDSDSDYLKRVASGAVLYHKEKFKGNGRTCATCHPIASSGTLNPAQVEATFRRNSKDPLFRSIDSDDGVGNSYTRLRQHATIRATINLPPNIRIAGQPNVTQVTLNRGIPTTFDIPALDNVLMYDGRHPTLQAQALGAVNDHAQPGRQPKASELNDIATFQKELFSSKALRSFAKQGVQPVLPEGTTESEKRGRVFFLNDGLCGLCHGGPMLDATQPLAELIAGIPVGSRFTNILVSEFNTMGNPVYNWEISLPDGSTLVFPSPDPGRALITGNPADFGAFKINTLWNIKNTAPYFHDNSAKTLEEMIAHYAAIFPLFGAQLTPQDQADILAYIKLL